MAQYYPNHNALVNPIVPSGKSQYYPEHNALVRQKPFDIKQSLSLPAYLKSNGPSWSDLNYRAPEGKTSLYQMAIHQNGKDLYIDKERPSFMTGLTDIEKQDVLKSQIINRLNGKRSNFNQSNMLKAEREIASSWYTDNINQYINDRKTELRASGDEKLFTAKENIYDTPIDYLSYNKNNSLEKYNKILDREFGVKITPDQENNIKKNIKLSKRARETSGFLQAPSVKESQMARDSAFATTDPSVNDLYYTDEGIKRRKKEISDKKQAAKEELLAKRSAFYNAKYDKDGNLSRDQLLKRNSRKIKKLVDEQKEKTESQKRQEIPKKEGATELQKTSISEDEAVGITQPDQGQSPPERAKMLGEEKHEIPEESGAAKAGTQVTQEVQAPKTSNLSKQLDSQFRIGERAVPLQTRWEKEQGSLFYDAKYDKNGFVVTDSKSSFGHGKLAMAVGAVVGMGALVHALSDSRGQQSNAQLYGQQPMQY